MPPDPAPTPIDQVHTQVARLSLSRPDAERRAIAAYLRDEAPGVASTAKHSIAKTMESATPPKTETELFTLVERPKSKRRRSSVASLTATRKKKFLVPPDIKYDEGYAKKKISVSDVRDLILHVLCESYSNIPPPRWCTVVNRSLIEHVVFLFVPGLQARHFGYPNLIHSIGPQPFLPPLTTPEAEAKPMPFFSTTFNHVWPLVAPGSRETLFSSMHGLTSVPLTKKEKDKLKKDPAATKRLVLPDLFMTYEQMVSNGYPLHPETTLLASSEETAGGARDSEPTLDSSWVHTVKFDHDGSHTFALDCEMCLSATGKVLTRVSLVDFNDTVVIDEYVKPAEPIVDYLTQYSGVSEATLVNVTTTLSDVQQLLRRTLSLSDVLIGHSLESDLNVLCMTHPKIIDTSLVYEHARGPPSKASLKSLASKYLNREIQNGGPEGHSSVEDAQACMDLVKLKLISGEAFGRNVSDVSLFKKLQGDSKRPNTSLVLDTSAIRNSSTAETRIKVSRDEEVVSELRANVSKYDFVVAKLRSMEHASHQEGALTPEQLQTGTATINSLLTTIHADLPNNTALFVCSGNGDVRDLVRLQNKKREYQREHDNKRWDEIKDAWNDVNLEPLKSAAERARDALLFFTVKTTGLELSQLSPMKMERTPEGDTEEAAKETVKDAAECAIDDEA